MEEDNELNIDVSYGEDQIVAFIDVLGFKDLLAKKKNSKITKYFQLAIKTIRELKNINTKREINYVLISDAIVLTFPFKNKLENLNEFLVALGRLQTALCLEDIWVRGAVTIGKIKIKRDDGNKIVFGPALVRAYELESKIAKFPRIILDTEIYKKVKKTRGEVDIALNKLNEDSSIFTRVLYSQEPTLSARIPVQDAIWIHYLEYLIKENNLETLIVNLKKNLYQKQEYFEKYKWVQNYALSFYSSDIQSSELIKRLEEL